MNARKHLTTLAVIATSLVLTTGCSLLPKEQTDAQIPVVTVPTDTPKILYAVAKGNIVQQLHEVGRVTGIQDAELTFSQSRRLKELNVKVGDHVDQGEVLAVLDDQGQKIQAEQAQINLERAQLQLQQAKARAKGKLDSFDEQLLELNIKSAQIAYDDAESQLTGLEMVAPFSGVVLQVNANVGQQVDAGKTLIQLTDPSGVALKVPFTRDDAKQLRAGQKATCLLSSQPTIPVKATVAELPDFTKLEGAVSTNQSASQNSINPMANGLLHFDTKLPENKIGDSVDVTVILAEHDNVMELPTNAVRQMGNSSFVIVYNGDQKKEVSVSIGLQSPTMTEIVKGVSVGDKVVGK